MPSGVYFNLLAQYLLEQVQSSFRSRSDFEPASDGSDDHMATVQRFVDRCMIDLWNKKLLSTDRVRFKTELIAAAYQDAAGYWVPPKFNLRWVAEPLPSEA